LPGQIADDDFVEGVSGYGDEFMLGERSPEQLPEMVIEDVRTLAARARKGLGPVRLEWVHDGTRAWVAQMHLSAQWYSPNVINPGEPQSGWSEFDAADGLEALAETIAQAQRGGRGVLVSGNVGVTSHVGDLLRKAGIPARMA
jgi:hypothetical protein